MDLLERLMALQDINYKDFNSKLIPNIDKDRFIGVKTPELKIIAKELFHSNNYLNFIRSVPHYYFEENQIHAFILSEIKNYSLCIELVEEFLPYIDNWATCDQLIIKNLKKNPYIIMDKINVWIKSDKTYTVRFAIGLLMRYFLDDYFDVKYLDLVAGIDTDDYYINMMSAWFFATALAKRYEDTIPYIKNNYLHKWVHNKTISKAIESFRVSDNHKIELKSLKRTN